MSKELMKPASDDVLAQLEEGYATEEGGRGIYLPRIDLLSKDKVETTGTGKNKKVKVLEAAGEFSINKQSEEIGEDGKKKWEKEEIGTEFEAIIFFKRYQMRHFDEATEKYTSSPIFDSKDEVIPLFSDKKQVDKGTMEELQAKYMHTNKNGKQVSALEQNRILYVLKDGEAYQMNLRGSSMYQLMAYERAVGSPTSVVTKFSSEETTKGDNTWNMMTFIAVRKINEGEARKVLELKESTLEAIRASKAGFEKSDEQKAVDQDFAQIGTSKK